MIVCAENFDVQEVIRKAEAERMLVTTTKLVQNGAGKKLCYTYETDTTKPKCYVEGYAYKFAQRLVSVESVKE